MKSNKLKPLSVEELIAEYSPVIYRIAFARLNNVPDAEDITQEVLIKYIKSDMKFNDEDHRRKWLIRVTVNAVNSLVTGSWNKRTVPLDEVCDSYTEDCTDALDIQEALCRLPEKYRIPIHLFYFEDMTISQIAEVTDSTEGTVKSLLSRGRNKLKEMLKEDDYV